MAYKNKKNKKRGARAFGIVVATTASLGCGGTESDPTPDATTTSDAATTEDAASAEDTATQMDAAMAMDTGSQTDAGLDATADVDDAYPPGVRG